MNHTTRLFIAILAFALPFSMRSSAADAPIKHRLLFTEYGKGPNRFVEVIRNRFSLRFRSSRARYRRGAR
jgi:hypothetical protein